MELERRFITDATVEVRKANAKTGMTVGGYAARFDTLSENLGGFREQIQSGAFSDCLRDDVRAFFNHDPNIILGRTAAGTCRISQDSKGLAYEVDLPDTQAARDLMVAIERGDVTQSSFGFRVAVNGDTWDENEDGVYIRTITKVARLYDVSPVAVPAYPDTAVAARSLTAVREARQAEVQRALDAAKAQRAAAHQARQRRIRLLEVSAPR